VLYQLLKGYARLAIHLYCVELRCNQTEWLQQKGPVLFAANHPNSFLDGVILTTLCDAKLYSLARGDAFKTPLMNKVLRSIHLLPVYRTSEGVENLEHNYTTFKDCIQAFRDEELVLIFSEGRCENEWHFRPLKKGTARLAISAWQQGIPLTVVPLAFNYSSFKKFGKAVHLSFGRPIVKQHMDWTAAEGRQNLQFNTLLQEQLSPMIYEIAEGDRLTIDRHFRKRKTALTYLALPIALLAAILYAPLLGLCTLFAELRFKTSGHYDSVQTSLLLLGWPLYVLLCTITAYHFVGPLGLLTPVAMYMLAWVGVRVKYAFRW
jgi:1-acyl-sn-glycerol-3-phosphate acyltransferase